MIKSFLEKHAKAINDAKWILGISIIFFFIISSISWDSQNALKNLMGSFFLFVTPFICFLPAEILIILIFKIIKSENWKIFWAAFLIPFCNMIYFLCERAYTYYFKHHCFVWDAYETHAEGIGATSLFFVLPVIAFITMCIPKRKLNYKKQIIKCLSLMIVLGWLLVSISYTITEPFECSLDDW